MKDINRPLRIRRGKRRHRMRKSPDVQDAMQRAVAAKHEFGRALVRKHLRERNHRRVSNEQVEAYFHAWVVSGGFTRFVAQELHSFLQELGSDTGSPLRHWPPDRVHRLTEDYFLRLTESINRPKGRPRKRRELIAGAVLEGKAARRKQKKIERDDLEKRFAAVAAGAKLKAFAEVEKQQYLKEGYSDADADRRFGNPSGVLRYMNDAEIDLEEVMSKRLKRGVFMEFCSKYRLNAREESALRKRLQRMKQLDPENLALLARTYAGFS